MNTSGGEVRQPGDPLTPAGRAKVEAARRKAFVLYEGRRVPHRSCGIALAETFNLPTRPFQSLRRGGITGEGECGAIKAGELVLGYFLGDPDPAGTVTEKLRGAARLYREAWIERIDLGPAACRRTTAGGAVDIVCNHLTAPLGDFHGEARQGFCTNIAARVAEIVAEILVRSAVDFEVTPIPGFDEESGTPGLEVPAPRDRVDVSERAP
jgi:hypothetical protein